MADLFRDGAFPRRIDRVVIRTEATLYIFGGLLLALFLTAEELDEQEMRSPFRVWIEIITSQGGIIGLGLVSIVVGIFAWWASLKRSRRSQLEYSIFGFFLVRLYAFLAVVVTSDGIEDTRWIHHLPWVIIWSAYWLMSRLRHEDE